MLNEFCIKDLINFIDQNLKRRPNGKPQPIKMPQALKSEILSLYSKEAIWDAAEFLYLSHYIQLSAPKKNPNNYHIIGITPQGREFVSAVNEPRLWAKLQPLIKTAATATITELIKHWFS